MKKMILGFIMVFSTSAFAGQTLQAAILKNPNIGSLVKAIQSVSGVECLTVDSFQSSRITGPNGKMAVVQQAPCFESSENPDQIGQLIVTYYGDGESSNSDVGEVIDIQFSVWK